MDIRGVYKMKTGSINHGIMGKKVFKGSIVLIIAFFAILYLSYFFTTGAVYDGTFLKKEGEYPHVEYVGKSGDGHMHILINALDDEGNNVEIEFRLPNKINIKYFIEFKDRFDEIYKFVKIQDQSRNTVFEGLYDENSPFLFDNAGSPYLDSELIRITVGGQSIYNEDYKVSFKEAIDLSTFKKREMRGDMGFLLYALILFSITAIDIKFPLFFFKLNHFLSVKDPEPTDFFYFMQKLSRVLMAGLGVIFLIVAVN